MMKGKNGQQSNQIKNDQIKKKKIRNAQNLKYKKAKDVT